MYGDGGYVERLPYSRRSPNLKGGAPVPPLLKGGTTVEMLCSCGLLLLALCLTGCTAFDFSRSSRTDPAPPPLERIDWSKHEPRAARLRFYAAVDSPAPGWTAIEPSGGPTLYVSDTPVVTEADVLDALAFHRPRNSIVQIRFTGIGTMRLQQLSRAHRGQWIAIYVDDQLLATARMNNEVSSGSVVLRGHFSKSQAEELAAKLRNEPAPTAQPGWLQRLFRWQE